MNKLLVEEVKVKKKQIAEKEDIGKKKIYICQFKKKKKKTHKLNS